ncbi:hypothetical protein [Kitasatospora sp. NPDC059571]|uniref:hypothetical protein n=1 Tax=Kitasatospora sp. NPDC059571 TaxID=3346871 RepID=UPI0036B4D417
MGELRGSYRVHFVLASALCGAALLCLVSTWLPGRFTVPAWLCAALFVGVFPVFVVALFRCIVAARLTDRANGHLLVRYVPALPPALKVTYAVVCCLAALGVATGAGTAEDAKADASGYYYTSWDRTTQPQHSVRVELTESEYHEALKGEVRIFSSGPAVFYAVASFLVLASASAAASRTRTASPRSAGTGRRSARP